MSSVLDRPVPSSTSVPQAKRWTCREYHRLGEQGVFEGTRTFLIDGEIYQMAPGEPPHSTSSNLIPNLLAAAFGPGFAVRQQSPLVLSQSTDPEPDIAVVRGSLRDYATSHPTTAALVVEVSDSTRRFDLNDKASLYAAGGIAEYWVLDLVDRRLVVHRDPRPAPQERFGAKYADVTVHLPGANVTPTAAANPVAVSDMLP